MNELLSALVEDIDVAPTTQLVAELLPAGRTERRVRVALHLCLEHADDVGQLLHEIDSLAVWLCQHDDSATGTALLTLGDALREVA